MKPICVNCGKEICIEEGYFDFISGPQCQKCGEVNWPKEAEGIVL